jgi:hypothetical protein
MEELRMQAIDEIREDEEILKIKPELASMHSKKIWSKYQGLVRDTMRSISQRESGQARRDIERLTPDEGANHTSLLIDGQEAKVVGSPGTTTIVSVLPQDVKGEPIAEKIREQGLKAETTNMPISQSQLAQLAAKIAAAAK